MEEKRCTSCIRMTFGCLMSFMVEISRFICEIATSRPSESGTRGLRVVGIQEDKFDHPNQLTAHTSSQPADTHETPVLTCRNHCGVSFNFHTNSLSEKICGKGQIKHFCLAAKKSPGCGVTGRNVKFHFEPNLEPFYHRTKYQSKSTRTDEEQRVLSGRRKNGRGKN